MGQSSTAVSSKAPRALAALKAQRALQATTASTETPSTQSLERPAMKWVRDGDYAIDNINWRIYGPRSGGVWGKAKSMLPRRGEHDHQRPHAWNGQRRRLHGW